MKICINLELPRAAFFLRFFFFLAMGNKLTKWYRTNKVTHSYTHYTIVAEITISGAVIFIRKVTLTLMGMPTIVTFLSSIGTGKEMKYQIS